MPTIHASIRDRAPRQVLSEVISLDAVLDQASAEARTLGRLNVVVLSAPNRDWLSLVLGGQETAVSFNYGHGDLPYFASVGEAQTDEQVLTAFVGLEHHTEFPRRWVAPIAMGRQAAREFLCTGERPTSLRWEEV